MFLLQNTSKNLCNHQYYSKCLVYIFFAMPVGDAKFGLRADLELQTYLNGSPAYPNGETLFSS